MEVKNPPTPGKNFLAECAMKEMGWWASINYDTNEFYLNENVSSWCQEYALYHELVHVVQNELTSDLGSSRELLKKYVGEEVKSKIPFRNASSFVKKFFYELMPEGLADHYAITVTKQQALEGKREDLIGLTKEIYLSTGLDLRFENCNREHLNGILLPSAEYATKVIKDANIAIIKLTELEQKATDQGLISVIFKATKLSEEFVKYVSILDKSKYCISLMYARKKIFNLPNRSDSMAVMNQLLREEKPKNLNEVIEQLNKRG